MRILSQTQRQQAQGLRLAHNLPPTRKDVVSSGPRPTKSTVKTLIIPPMSPRPEFLILQISTLSLSAVMGVKADVGASQLPAGGTAHLEVLMGDSDNVNMCASACSQSLWLQVIAHNIFNPIHQCGCLWTHSQGALGTLAHPPQKQHRLGTRSSKHPYKVGHLQVCHATKHVSDGP
jgi:hypothetical protein